MSLTGKQIKDSYKQVMNVGDSTNGLTVSLQYIVDGDGTNSTIQVSTTACSIDSLTVTTGLTLGATTATTILDEDAMGSDSATALATQQSIKAYVDTQVASAGGNTVLLTSVTASSDTYVELDNIFSDTYDYYYIVCNDFLPQTDNVDLQMQVGTGATPTYDTGANYTDGIGTGQSQLLLDTGIGNATGEGCSFTLEAFNPHNASNNAKFFARGQGISPAGNINTIFSGGQYEATTAVTSVRIGFSSGNVVSGQVYVYGVKKT